jgi:hypothetical protein
LRLHLLFYILVNAAWMFRDSQQDLSAPMSKPLQTQVREDVGFPRLRSALNAGGSTFHCQAASNWATLSSTQGWNRTIVRRLIRAEPTPFSHLCAPRFCPGTFATAFTQSGGFWTRPILALLSTHVRVELGRISPPLNIHRTRLGTRCRNRTHALRVGASVVAMT